MTFSLIVLAGVAAVAGSAPAREIAVPIVGRDDAAVKADIRKAAAEVCRTAFDVNIMATMDENRCRYRIIAKTEAKLAEARATNARVLAQNTPAK